MQVRRRRLGNGEGGSNDERQEESELLPEDPN